MVFGRPFSPLHVQLFHHPGVLVTEIDLALLGVLWGLALSPRPRGLPFEPPLFFCSYFSLSLIAYAQAAFRRNGPFWPPENSRKSITPSFMLAILFGTTEWNTSPSPPNYVDCRLTVTVFIR